MKLNRLPVISTKHQMGHCWFYLLARVHSRDRNGMIHKKCRSVPIHIASVTWSVHVEKPRLRKGCLDLLLVSDLQRLRDWQINVLGALGTVLWNRSKNMVSFHHSHFCRFARPKKPKQTQGFCLPRCFLELTCVFLKASLWILLNANKGCVRSHKLWAGCGQLE